MPLIQAEHITVKKGSNDILQDINWEIQPREKWVLFGLNGCGKTTLLSILAGYQTAREGKNYLFGQQVDKENFLTLRQRVGFVSSSFFDRYLHQETVQDIVWAGKFGTLGLVDEISDEDVRKGKAIMRQLGLDKKMRYPYDCLSKGQQQRVLIARALMADPEILLLDEPCSGLDLIARERFLHMVQTLVEERDIAVVYVTHHTEEILPFFNKAALMKDGALFAQGDLKTVFSDDVLTAFFGAKSNVLWSDQHFFINIDLGLTHKNNRTFSEVN